MPVRGQAPAYSRQLSLLHVHRLPVRSISNHLACPLRRFSTIRHSRAFLFPTAFPMRSGSHADFSARQACSGLHLSPAGSPDMPSRSEFVILRTGPSPPIALHLASERRSYGRLQNRDAILERTAMTVAVSPLISPRAGWVSPLVSCSRAERFSTTNHMNRTK